MSFSLDVAKWAKDAEENVATIHKAIVFDLFTSVILDTPVLEGRLRGNWIISDGSPASGVSEVATTSQGVESSSSKEPPRGPVTTGAVNDVFKFVSNFDEVKDFDVYLTNNLPYAHRVEYDGWSHTKAPEGMVRKNLVRITENLKRA